MDLQAADQRRRFAVGGSIIVAGYAAPEIGLLPNAPATTAVPYWPHIADAYSVAVTLFEVASASNHR